MNDELERRLQSIESKLKDTSKKPSCLTILGFIFLILKLAEIGPVATWSWWWVLFPFTLQLSLIVLVIVLLVIIVAANAK